MRVVPWSDAAVSAERAGVVVGGRIAMPLTAISHHG